MDIVFKGITYLANEYRRQPTINEISNHLQVSEGHFSRIFKVHTGVSPKLFLQGLTHLDAKSLLESQLSTAKTSLDLGLSGSSRLYDLCIQQEGMSPGSYKRKGDGVLIFADSFETPLGPAIISATEHGLNHLSFHDQKVSPGMIKKTIKGYWPNADIEISRSPVARYKEYLLSRLSGEKIEKISLHLMGTSFQIKVWKALLNLKSGQLTYYKEIANLIGHEKAQRAVGTAVGANPISILIPCHRVIRSTGIVGNYRWGAMRKRALLSMELTGHKN